MRLAVVCLAFWLNRTEVMYDRVERIFDASRDPHTELDEASKHAAEDATR